MIMNSLPPSSKIVLRILGNEGAMTHKDIVKKSHCAPRTVRYALRKLKERNLLIEKANLRDMRQIIYQYRMIPLQVPGMADPAPGSGNVTLTKNINVG
jgi:DNA-binding MarR family transcriptional regulator